ncbi:hypothetical protein BRD00_09335 [Halobacteriales archaeon QS_8_69_26]|nr:MAG: hypothetical protein BRD00_09335 [Halobacteriales archaeon QS_8_69_26]
MFQREVQLPAGSREEFPEVFPVPAEPVEYRVYVELENGTNTGYAFENRQGSGFVNLAVDVRSASEVTIGYSVT